MVYPFAGGRPTERQALEQIAVELFHLRGHLERSLPIWGGTEQHPRPPDVHRPLATMASELTAVRERLDAALEGRGSPP